MAISMYQASVPVLVHVLSNLKSLLEKGVAHAEARKIDPAVLLGGRLYPDMFALCRQVQIASDTAKGGVARLAGREAPKYEDNETSFAELIARLEKTIDYIRSVPEAEINGSEERPIVLTLPSRTLTFKGLDYLQNFVIPNVYFHEVTTYGILRHNGVELGKQDFLGPIQP